MQNLFNRTRPDRDAVRQIKELISEGFGLPDTTTLAVAELRCHELGCPPIETVMTALSVPDEYSPKLPKQNSAV